MSRCWSKMFPEHNCTFSVDVWAIGGSVRSLIVSCFIHNIAHVPGCFMAVFRVNKVVCVTILLLLLFSNCRRHIKCMYAAHVNAAGSSLTTARSQGRTCIQKVATVDNILSNIWLEPVYLHRIHPSTYPRVHKTYCCQSSTYAYMDCRGCSSGSLFCVLCTTAPGICESV